MKTTLLSLKAFFTICLLCLVGGVNVMAQDTETVDFTKQGYTDKKPVPEKYNGTDFQITFSKGSGSTAPTFYKNASDGDAIRLYKSNTISISSSTKKIKEISFTYAKGGSKDIGYESTSGSYSTESKKWTSSKPEEGVSSVTLTVPSTKKFKHYRLQQVTVTFVGGTTSETETPAPTINPASQTFSESFVATISCTDAAAKIYYTLDGSDPKVSNTRSEYTTGIEIPTQTTTLKACAVVGEKTSSVATATYTYVHVYENIASLKAAAVSGEKYRVKFNNAVVTCTHYNNVYIEDNSGAIVFYKKGNGLEEGNTLNGVTDVKYDNYQGLNQLTDLDKSQLTIGTGAEIPVTDVDIATLNANMSKYESMRIRIKKAHVTTNNFDTDKEATLKQGESSILLYKKGSADMDAIQNNAIVDVIGYPTIFKNKDTNTNEIYIWKGDDAMVSTDKFTITSAQYGTYYTEDAFVMPEGVTGYTITDKNGESLTLNATYPANEVVPAKTALLLKATEQPATNKEFTYTIVNSDKVAPEGNLLHGSVEATKTQVEGATAYYKLAKGEEGIGFYWANENGTAFTNGANKAYLAITGKLSQMRGFSFESMTTGINNVVANTNNSKNAVIYDINGRRVNSLNAAKGVYIVNGKKVIVK